MKSVMISITAALVMAAMLVACSSGSKSNSANYFPATPTGPAVITTATQGSQAASAVAQARDLVLTSTLLFKNLGDIGLSKMTPSVPATATPATCTDGGTYSYLGTYAAPRYTMTFVFNGCREGGYQYVGTYTLSGTPALFTITLGDSSSSFNIFNFDTGYTVLKAYLKATRTFTMTSSGTLPNTSGSINSSVAITSFDYFLLDSFDMSLSRLTAAYTQTSDASLNETTSITVDGSFAETWAGRVNSAQMTFTGFKVDRVRNNASVAPAVNYASEDVSVDGRVAFSFRPSSFGYSGIFDVVTTTPFHYIYAPSKHTTTGALAINGAATEQLNAGGDLTLNVVGDPTILTYAKEYALMKVSDYAAMEQDKPPLLGPTSTPGSPITDATTMAVTLTWTGPAPSFASTSDMDLHVKYYNVVAPAGGAPTWHMDFHQSKTFPGGGVCTDPVGIVFSDAFDLDGAHTGTCDVGLDFDDTNGYGPEHITALKIPSGYYVVSVNSYALPVGENGTTLYLSLHLGDNIYGPYVINPVSASDTEGTTPTAWFRVADVRVNADASIDVLTPNTALDPWGH